MISNKNYFFDQLKNRKKEFIGIEKGIEFLEYFQSNLKSENIFSQSESYIILYDIVNYDYLKVYVNESDFNHYFAKFYDSFIINKILLKTKFALNLALTLKKLKVKSKLKLKKKTKNFIKIFISLILTSLLQSRDFNANSFDETIFYRNIHDNIIDQCNIDYLYLFIQDLFSKLKKDIFFFSLEKNKISIKDNLFYLLLSSFDDVFPLVIKSYDNSSYSELELLNFFHFNKELKEFVKQELDLKMFHFTFNLLDKAQLKIEFRNYELYYFDLYNIDLFDFNNLIKKNKILIYYFNKIFKAKFNINKLLFYIVVSSCFDHFFFLKSYNLLNYKKL